MFFKKKKHKGPVPAGQIKEMTRRGMPDKIIIKKLKKEGYSYDEIEHAMLGAVKEGVSEEPVTQPAASYGATGQTGPVSIDELYAPVQQAAPMEETVTAPEVNPEALIEELIEGVIDEKWEKFNKKIKKYEDDLERIETMIKQFEQKVHTAKEQPISKEFELRSDVLNNKMDDLESRIGGLEKAFKQFLPSLTRNIENLSSMIHELKAKSDGTYHSNKTQHTQHTEHHTRS